MKLFFYPYYRFILFMALGFCGLSVSAQNQHKKVVVEGAFETEVSSTTLSEWLELFERHGYSLSYNASLLDLNQSVSLPAGKFTVDEFLHELFSKYDFAVRHVSGHKILIKIEGLRTRRFSGQVLNGESGETLYHYVVVLTASDGKQYRLTDKDGAFSAVLPVGKYTVSVSYLGFHPLQRTVHLEENTQQSFRLVPLSIPMSEVVITPSPLTDVANAETSYRRLSVSTHDPLASVKYLPGVSGSFETGNLHVNGGQSDENQILLDGIPIYHSHHNNSLVSLFNGDAVKNIVFYDSFIPAQYEGRLSSVTDIKLKSGDSLHHRQRVNLEMPAAAVTLEGPVVKNKLTYLVSGRHSWIDLLQNAVESVPGLTRSFNDLTAKLVYHVNPRTCLQGVVYRSNDVYNDSIGDVRKHKILQWRGSVYSLGLNTRLGRMGKISHTTRLGYSEYANKVFGPAIQIEGPFYIKEGMRRLNLKTDFKMKLDEWVTLSYGLKFSHEHFDLLASKDTVENNQYKISQISMYVNTQLRLTKNLLGSVALNVVSYLPQGYSTFVSIQPRFTLKYLMGEQNVFSLDFSRMEQFYHNICMDEIAVPADFRMPSIKGFKPSSSVHIEGGWRHQGDHWYGSLSAYYKRRYNILGIRYHIAEEMTEWNRFIMNGNAHSGGVKLRCSASLGRWMADFSYAYSRSMEWFEEYDGNRKHPALHDLPNIFNWGASYLLGKRSYLTVGGYVKSGYFTNNFIDVTEPGVFYVRNKRTRSNYRLDMSFLSSKSLARNKIELQYKLGLYNMIGNPRKEEIIDLYSLDTGKHFLPYFAVNLAF